MLRIWSSVVLLLACLLLVCVCVCVYVCVCMYVCMRACALCTFAFNFALTSPPLPSPPAIDSGGITLVDTHDKYAPAPLPQGNLPRDFADWMCCDV